MVVIISDRRLFTEPDLVCKPYVDIFGLVTHSSPISAREIVDEEVLINVVRKLCEFFIGNGDRSSQMSPVGSVEGRGSAGLGSPMALKTPEQNNKRNKL